MPDGKSPDVAQINDLLKRLILTDKCRVDRFDASYLDDLPDILREMHGITSLAGDGGEAALTVQRLAELVGLAPGSPLIQLAPALRKAGVSDTDFSPPRLTSASLQKRFRYVEIPAWQSVEGITSKSGPAAVEKIKSFQEQYSRKDESRLLGIIKRGHNHEFTDLGRPETGDPWTGMFQSFIRQGLLSSNEPVLTIGPRWAGEVTYFRERVGLSQTIGLDLFSHDQKLVKVGDMHAMPFPDSHFGLVYQRNTFNKSYDIRAAMRECVRVLRPGGILASDECLGYAYGVDEAARTNITCNQWYLRFLGDAVEEILHNVEMPAFDDWIKHVGQFAVKIRK